MSWTFIIIIAVLVFIAYQLSQLNRGKKYELELKVAEKVAEKKEEKIRELFPHLFPIASEDMREEIRDFFVKSTQEDVMETDSLFDDYEHGMTGYIYLERYKTMSDKIDTETDLKKKERMQSVKEDISKELKQWESRLDSMIDKGKISEWEKSFILWDFIKPINDQFPERHFELEDYFETRFRGLQTKI